MFTMMWYGNLNYHIVTFWYLLAKTGVKKWKKYINNTYREYTYIYEFTKIKCTIIAKYNIFEWTIILNVYRRTINSFIVKKFIREHCLSQKYYEEF